MKKILIYTIPIIIPVLVLVLVNETAAPYQTFKEFYLQDVKTQNSAAELAEDCSWACHNNTAYCKAHHVKILKPYFHLVDPIYYGIINSLKATGHYQLANIIFLVIGWPALMYLLLVKSILVELQIRKIKKSHA